MEVLSAAHNIVSTGLENLPEHLRKKQVVYYSDKKDMVVIAGWGENTGMIGEMIADCLELSQEGKEKAEEFCLSSGNDCVISLNEALKEIARIRREKRPATMRIDDIRIYPCFAAHPRSRGRLIGKNGSMQSPALPKRKLSWTAILCYGTFYRNADKRNNSFTME